MNGAAQSEAAMLDLQQQMVVAIENQQFEECKALKAEIASTKAKIQKPRQRRTEGRMRSTKSG